MIIFNQFDLKVDTERLSQDSNQLKDELTMIEKKVDKMYEEVFALSDMWKGVAKSKFVNSFQKDYNVMKQMIAVLQQYAQRLIEESSSYKDCEMTVIDMVNDI